MAGFVEVEVSQFLPALWRIPFTIRRKFLQPDMTAFVHEWSRCFDRQRLTSGMDFDAAGHERAFRLSPQPGRNQGGVFRPAMAEGPWPSVSMGFSA